MDYFFFQLKHNIDIVLKNISNEYLLDYKKLKKKFLPKKLTKALKNDILRLEKLVEKNDNCEYISTNYFVDKDSNIYVIINDTRNLAYNSVYDSIKI